MRQAGAYGRVHCILSNPLKWRSGLLVNYQLHSRRMKDANNQHYTEVTQKTEDSADCAWIECKLNKIIQSTVLPEHSINRIIYCFAFYDDLDFYIIIRLLVNHLFVAKLMKIGWGNEYVAHTKPFHRLQHGRNNVNSDDMTNTITYLRVASNSAIGSS